MWEGTKTFTLIPLTYYNFDDFNRTNANIQYLKDNIEPYGFSINLSYPLVDVDRTDFPKVTLVNQLKQDILDVIAGFYAPPPDTPAIIVNNARKQKFDYVEANKLEQNIQAIFDMFQGMANSVVYCGESVTGEDLRNGL